MSLHARKRRGKKAALILFLVLLLAALGVASYYLINIMQENDQVMKDEKALEGVLVNGVDIAGMDKTGALAVTSKIPDEVLSKIAFTVNISGKAQILSAGDLGLTTDYEDTVQKALDYGHTGSLGERKKAIDTAKESGKDFKVKAKVDEEKLKQALQALKEKTDIAPQEASFEFMPWGYTADKKAYEQNQDEMIKACANGKTWDRPKLVQIADDQMPNKLRYEYWKNIKYVTEYIPVDANVSRFMHKEAVEGKSLNVDKLSALITSAVEKGDYSEITAPIDTVKPTGKTDGLKDQVQLIASWTSSYSEHHSYDRIWNVTKMSGIVNGQIIKPGEEWSINKTAGDRTAKAGWKEADGIENGGYVPQPGGGVCQISSTLYNAAIRSGLEVTESKHHSIKSNYIPDGLDATISSGSPDLKIKNNNGTPVYIVCYMNPKEQNVTVEIYGEPVVDPTYGPCILHFDSKSQGKSAVPPITNIYNTAVCPENEKAIAPGKSYPFSKSQPSEKINVFKHIWSLDGEKKKTEPFGGEVNIKQIKGKTYWNCPDPATLPPTPSPAPSPSPSTSPSAAQ